MKLHPLDVLVILAYALLTVAVGLRFARRNTTTDRYFLGGRNFPGWAIGLSFIGSTISSITFIAYPADSFKTAWLRILPPLAFPLVVLLAAYAFIPFFRRGTVRSAYHYLALRFGPSVSVYAGLVYLAMQVTRAATVTYLLAVLLSSMTELPVAACIVLSAGVTAVYTIKGGFEAVVWTDVIQTIVLLSGAIACVLFIVHALPQGLWQVLTEAWAANKLSLHDLNPATGKLEPVASGFSLSEKTALMLVLVGMANYLAGQLDQDSVQRWCSARSAKEARKAMFVLGFGAIPIWAGFMFLGTCLWVYYQHFPTDVSAAILAGKRKAEDICKADMLIKGQDVSNIKLGNTLSADQLHAQKFDYMLSNPPFGVDWKKIEGDITQEHTLKGFDGRFGPGLPRVSDGSLLFLLHLLSNHRRRE